MPESVLTKLAAAGLIVSFLLHLATFTHFRALETNPLLFALVLGGTLLLWGATRRIYRKLSVGLTFLDRCTLKFAPRGARNLYFAVLVYSIAVISLFAVVLLQGGKPSRIDGRPVLLLLNKTARPITEEQYQKYRAYQLSILMAYSMVSYSFTAVVQYAATRLDKTSNTNHI
jgi:hypothetical protein